MPLDFLDSGAAPQELLHPAQTLHLRLAFSI